MKPEETDKCERVNGAQDTGSVEFGPDGRRGVFIPRPAPEEMVGAGEAVVPGD